MSYKLTRLAGSRSVIALLALACGAGSTTPTSATSSTNTGDTSTSSSATTSLPPGYEKFTNRTSVKISGNYIVISTSDIPNHKSPYFGVGSPMYMAPQAGMIPNPNSIAAQSYVFNIPISPTVAATPSDTPMDAIGVALNGVVFFNQYAAGRVPLTTEIISFDQYNGHPAMQNNYHYHFEPLYLTQSSKSALIGFILDGFPIYGPLETTGAAPTGLDACNGHTHATIEYPNGIYHYHVVSSPPYLVGCFKGTPGNVTN
jgi:YHYH protein